MRESSSMIMTPRHACYIQLLVGAALFALVVVSARAVDVGVCGSTGTPSFGPYDYRTATPAQLARIENYHFGAGVESLTKGNSTAVIGADLAFALRYFPNHHRVLATLVRLAKRERTNRPRGALTTVECYFELALKIAPDDGMVDLLYGMWLVDSGDRKAAGEHLVKATEHAPPDSANYQYNLGLGWFALGRFDEALTAAHAAYGMGYSLPGLRQKLEKAGKWRPLPQGTVSSPASVTASDPEGGGAADVPMEGKR